MDCMKNLFKGIGIVAILFLSTVTVSAQQKIGHINSNEIIQAMPEFQTANTEFETLQQSKEAELQQMGAEYQKKITEAQDLQRNRSAANSDSTDVKLQSLGVEIQEIERRIQEVQQLAQDELGKKQEELFAPIFQKANTAVQAVAKEQGYAYVFDLANSAIPYSGGGDNLTSAVMTKLGVSPSAAPAPTN